MGIYAIMLPSSGFSVAHRATFATQASYGLLLMEYCIFQKSTLSFDIDEDEVSEDSEEEEEEEEPVIFKTNKRLGALFKSL